MNQERICFNAGMDLAGGESTTIKDSLNGSDTAVCMCDSVMPRPGGSKLIARFNDGSCSDGGSRPMGVAHRDLVLARESIKLSKADHNRVLTMTQDPLIARKIREARLRDTAARRGFKLTKSRRRDPKAEDYGRYHLTDSQGRSVIGGSPGTDLDTIEAYLTDDHAKSHRAIVIEYSMTDEVALDDVKDFYDYMINELISLILQPNDEDSEKSLLILFREARQKAHEAGLFDKNIHVKANITTKNYCA